MIGVYICAGLCNRLFQLAYAYSFAKTHQLSFRLENWQNISHHSHQVYEWLIERFMALPNYVKEPVKYEIEIKENYDKFTTYVDFYHPCMQDKNVHVFGFFQNEKYFLQHREDILTLFKEPLYITEKINKHYQNILPYLDSGYFIHIRLGDYIGNEKHWVFLEQYYLTILQSLKGEFPIIIFTNSWSQLPIIYPNLYKYLQTIPNICIRDSDEVTCLYLMSRCKRGGICSNSTFGWWGGWLNPNPEKKLFFPSQWIRNSDAANDIYPTGSTIVLV